YCRVDFAWEIPGTPKGLVVEIDGIQHRRDDHRIADRNRDTALRASRWDVLRIPTSEVKALSEMSLDVLKTLTEMPYLRYAIQNCRQGYWADGLLRRLTQLSLMPIAVARVQRVLCEWLDCGILS